MSAGQNGSDVRRGASDSHLPGASADAGRGSSPLAGQGSQVPVVPRYNLLTDDPQTARGRKLRQDDPGAARHGGLPLVCADGLSRAQLAGRRCVVRSCRRWFAGRISDPKVIGLTIRGRPLRACGDHEDVLEAVHVIPGSLAGPEIPR
jgi:hypothetical protein